MGFETNYRALRVNIYGNISASFWGWKNIASMLNPSFNIVTTGGACWNVYLIIMYDPRRHVGKKILDFFPFMCHLRYQPTLVQKN